ncbi:ribosome biogenesis GTPase Der [Candidatus Tachikawaea gelatinosa]|uniref:GTPase Der n=1 Tax=Candidatus Tachikawaea gelatinosa TaxID=1410383 RepID=A0A090AQ35_9ENTR|nr:ribosome biogenesis GTPase Der [Candidatus Tachikawaea gelatinosa]BAP58447.1 GTPase Der [Candidatus Tachikawaea gelatinosa]
MIPIIALIGRANVGKSTLFNNLIGKNCSLVSDSAGTTRDRKYNFSIIKNNYFTIIDTGGISYKKDEMSKNVLYQTNIAIKKANFILFITDGSTGVLYEDKRIAKYLSLQNKKTFLLVNKIDKIDNFDRLKYDFYALGFEKIYPISSINKKEVMVLAQQIFFQSHFPKKKFCQKEQKHTPKIAFIGRPNTGKSTLINNLLNEERMIVSPITGTTIDSVSIPIKIYNNDYILIDTAGVRKKKKIKNILEKKMISDSLKTIKNSDIILLVIDVCIGVSTQDLFLINFILNQGKSLIIIINKYDTVVKRKKKEIKKHICANLNFISFVRIHFISALYEKKIKEIVNSINEANFNLKKTINTSKLMNIMHLAQKNHCPPLFKGRLIKLKYAHIGKYKPLTIIIHGNQVDHLPGSYKRYLEKYFHQSLKIISIKLFINFKKNNNPFKR